MGVPGLLAAVRRHGRFRSLSGESVVIDGPSLIFQVLHGCILKGPEIRGFICHPSYATVGRKVMGWLEDLRRRNVTVRKIYFDGYLPPSKWPVRRARLIRQSELIKALLISNPSGSTGIPEDAFERIGPDISLTRHAGDFQSHELRWLPKPSFLVPAVAEMLRSSPTWGPLVEVVSGEADEFCADDVRRHGGVLLTGDSDLLISELGPEGSVVFFSDVLSVDESGDSEELVACKFPLHAINDELGLNNVGGLLRVAFEKMMGKISFDEALSRAKDNAGDTLESFAFQAYKREHSMKEYLPKDHPAQKIIPSLDPRISEIVIQGLLLDGKETVPYAGSSENFRGPETLAMFLPVMIEDRNKRSAWTMSTSARKLAYGLIQTFTTHGSPAVIEYRSLGERSTQMGRQIDVLGSRDTVKQCCLLTRLIQTFKKLTKDIPGPDLQWLALAIYQDISFSPFNGGSHLSALLLDKSKGKSKDDDRYPWVKIHFAAQVQASLYSLRMVKQILDVAASLVAPLPPSLKELRECLSALPPIAEWPTVENISQLLASASEADILPTIIDIFGIPATVSESDFSHPKKGPTRISLPGRPGGPKRPRVVNPFAVLSDSSRY